MTTVQGNHLQADKPLPIEEIAAVIIRDYSDKLRGPKGEKGDAGPIGPKGGVGNNNNISSSNAMVAIDFSSLSSGIRLDGIEWGIPNCNRFGNKVTCEALIKNDSGEDLPDFDIFLSEYSDETRASTDTLTQNAIAGLTSKSWKKRFDRNVGFKFPANIVYPLKWDILNVPKESSGFTRMDIDTEGGLVKYQNIAILN